MIRFIIVGVVACLLYLGPATAQQRPECSNPPSKPGTCFVNTPFGAFFFLSDGRDFLFAETFGGTDDNAKLRPNGRISAHQNDRRARFVYCPAGVTGKDCLDPFFRPGPKSFAGRGFLHINTEMDPLLNFTCPSTVTAHAILTERATGEAFRMATKLMRVRNPDGSCRNVLYDIRLLP